MLIGAISTSNLVFMIEKSRCRKVRPENQKSDQIRETLQSLKQDILQLTITSGSKENGKIVNLLHAIEHEMAIK